MPICCDNQINPVVKYRTPTPTPAWWISTISAIVASELTICTVELSRMMVMGGANPQLPSGFELWNGGVTYSEHLDEAAKLVIDGGS